MRVWGEVRMADLIGYQTSAKMSATGLTTAFVRVPCHVAEGPILLQKSVEACGER